jgi:hypothetical protein
MTASPRTCFYIPPDQHDENGWIPSVVTEGEPGHAPLKGNGPCAQPWYWGKTLAEAEATADRENARLGLTRDEVLDIVLSSLRADLNHPEIRAVRDAEIRVYDSAPGTDDASDMYVMEVLGVTVRVWLIAVEEDDEGSGVPGREPYITVEAGGRFTVSVNEDPHYYND